MASTREIKNRIKSVSDTQKITNAMYLISSTKMRKARREAEESRPYFDLIRREIHRMFAIDEDVQSVYFRPSSGEAIKGVRSGILVITGDKGLAGAYNLNVIREAVSLMSEAEECVIYVVGEYGRRWFTSHDLPVDTAFDHPMSEPDLSKARMITLELLDAYDRGEFDRLYLCYTDYRGGLSAGEPMYERLLPFDREPFVRAGREMDVSPGATFEYVPDVKTVLESIIPSYFTGYIYAALVNSYSSEQNARMMAMDSANDNAGELLEELSMQYNHERQNAITQEITEISSGARSKKRSLAKHGRQK